MVVDLLFGNGTAAQAADQAGMETFPLGIALVAIAVVGVLFWYVTSRRAA